MSNIHGLDFLRKEHTLNDDGEPKVPSSSSFIGQQIPTERSQSWVGPDLETLAAQVANKPALEKQSDVIYFLKAHRSSGCLAPSVIYQCTGIDLQEDEAVADMLQHNPKIRVELVPDPENPSLMIATYAYQAKYNRVRDRTTLLAQINRCTNGVPRRDLEDAYDGVENDLDLLITAGDVLAVQNSEDKTQIIFPRGEVFLVELDGIIMIAEKPTYTWLPPFQQESDKTSTTSGIGGTAIVKEEGGTAIVKEENMFGDQDMPPPETETVIKKEPASASQDHTESQSIDPQSTQHSASFSPHENPESTQIVLLETDVDPQSQIRRGEAVQIGGQWFRISSAVKEGTLKEQPARAQAPLSVVMLQNLSKRNEQDGYIRPFTEKIIPVDHPLSDSALENLKKARQARERLQKVVHGRSGGVASQLLGSHAHSSNPTTLAASFGTTSMTGLRKRSHKGTAPDTQKGRQNQTDSGAQAKEAASDPFLSLYSHGRRHGCTNDVREMYLATRSVLPDLDVDLKPLLLKHKLLEPGEEMRRPRLEHKANVDNDGKPKKRRYYTRKNQRMTNIHLDGTAMGAALLRAQEKQKQGDAVGDGGM
jgi:hypothetical protein